MKIFYLSMISILLFSCELINGEIPKKNDLLNFNEPVTLTGLSQYNISIYDNSKIGGNRENIANKVDFNITDSEFFIHVEADRLKQEQKLYTVILESKKPIIVDRIDSIAIDFKLNVFTHEENPFQLSTDNGLIREYLDVKKNNDTKYTTIISDGIIDGDVSEYLLSNNTAFFYVRIRIVSVISGIPQPRAPFQYSEADYSLKFKLNGFYK
jgi:hypothetical protein